jgi:hypothetical protein
MSSYVDRFVVPLTFIPPDDRRDPPGDHHGTGWLVTAKDRTVLVTCEHVASFQFKGKLGMACYGADFGASISAQFELHPSPLDFAWVDASQQVAALGGLSSTTHRSHYADEHAPVDGEYLYVYGFPGEDSYPGYGQHNVQGLGVFSHEVPRDPKLAAAYPPSIHGNYVCFEWSPERATRLLNTTGDLTKPNGMSGSPLWNTRYVEVTQQGAVWTPEYSRITGIVWGHHAKSGCLVATRVESFISILFPDG